MTTPASFLTADGIIRSAMEDAGLLQEGEIPNSAQYAKFLVKLNKLVNYLQTQGLKLFVNELVDVTLVAGQATYTMSPTGDVVMTKPARVLEAYYVYSTTTPQNTFPLTILSWQDYNYLSSKGSQGSINSFFPNKQIDNVSVSFWNTPDAQAATGKVQLLTQIQVTNWVSLTDTQGFPVEWSLPLEWCLADEICTGQPEAIMNRCKERAMFYRESLEAWDVEDAPTQFTPDARQMSGTSRFM